MSDFSRNIEKRSSVSQFTSLAAPTNSKLLTDVNSNKLLFVSTGTTVEGEIPKTVPRSLESSQPYEKSSSLFVNDLIHATGDTERDRLVAAAASTWKANLNISNLSSSDIMTSMSNIDERIPHSSSLYNQLQAIKSKEFEDDEDKVSGLSMIEARSLAADEADFLEEERLKELNVQKRINDMDAKELSSFYSARNASLLVKEVQSSDAVYLPPQPKEIFSFGTLGRKRKSSDIIVAPIHLKKIANSEEGKFNNNSNTYIADNNDSNSNVGGNISSNSDVVLVADYDSD